ncbi:MAG: exosortase A [Gammaproteobacteria bacterium]|nr:exosortase A [Gammaproteobacteria bacterium]
MIDKTMENKSNLPFWFTGFVVLLLMGVYYETLVSMISIWERSETFAHGYLIFPISLYLIWTKKTVLLQLEAHPRLIGLWPLLFLGLIWMLARFVDVQVIQQYAFIAMIPVIVFTLLGVEITRAILFPLFFLIFAVPFGEFLITPMMNMTAAATVMAVKLTGIPVFVEGTFLTLPSGNWSVVEGCSGIRYLIASITLGCLYVYMMYRSTSRRVLFMALFIIVPIVGNWLRAYLIVMIGHFSGMKLATGVDHILYGWVFFGIVIGILFFVGLAWREDGMSDNPVEQVKQTNTKIISGQKMILTVFAVILSMVIWPVFSNYISSVSNTTYSISLDAPVSNTGWLYQPADNPDWQPRYLGADKEIAGFYEKDKNKVGLFVEYYYKQEQGAELVNSQNVMVRQKHPVWHNIGESEITLDNQPFKVRQTKLKSAGKNLLIWDWYWLDGYSTSNSYIAKMLEAKDKLLQKNNGAASIIIYAEYGENAEPARKMLYEFMQEMLPNVNKSLEDAVIN